MLADGLTQARLFELLQASSVSGVCWSTESDDLDCNFVTWRSGESVVEHVNSEVDVLILILWGSGRLSVNGKWTDLSPGVVSLVEKNAARAIVASDDGIAYFTVHKRRQRLMPGPAEARAAGQRNLVKGTLK